MLKIITTNPESDFIAFYRKACFAFPSTKDKPKIFLKTFPVTQKKKKKRLIFLKMLSMFFYEYNLFQSLFHFIKLKNQR